MKMYRIKLKCKSSILTSLHADTIFGHLCWMVAHFEGDDALKKFLHPFRNEKPPFIISDGFPGDLLPRPFSTQFMIDDPKKIKEIKKIQMLSIDDFNCVRRGELCSLTLPQKIETTMVTTHSSISRLTNSTFEEGGLYSLEETFIHSITIYLKVISDEWKDKVIELFNKLSKSGYGKKKSIGKGQFDVISVKNFCAFKDIEKADGFVTLSHFCPAENDPTEGLYKTFVKYGKLGEEFNYCGNPFKKPLVMIKAGSIFRTDKHPKEFYGRIIQDGIAPAKPDVVQYAYAFAIPIIYPKLNA